MKVEKELFLLKINYILRYGGLSTTKNFPLLASLKGVSPQAIGTIYSVIPFISLCSTMVTGALADYLKAHRTILLLTLAIFTFGSGSFYFAPKMPNATLCSDPRDDLRTGNTNATEKCNSSLGYIGNNCTAAYEVEYGEEDCTRSQYLSKEFWIILAIIVIQQFGMLPSCSIGDSVCFLILGPRQHLFGKQLMWGKISLGFFAVISGVLVDYYSMGLPEKDYLPAYIILIVLLILDMILVTKLPIPKRKSETYKASRIGRSLLVPRKLIFLLTTTVVGVAVGALWTFKFILIEQVSNEWKPNFGALKTLQGLIFGIETFCGDVPFFFLSGIILRKIGYISVFGVVLFFLGFQLFLYYFVVNPWYFLLLELLKGPSFSLFMICMSSYANHIAVPGTQATFQAIVRMCLTAGTAGGTFVSGFLYQKYGGQMVLLLDSALVFTYCAFYIVSQLLIRKCCPESDVPLEEKTPGTFTQAHEDFEDCTIGSPRPEQRQQRNRFNVIMFRIYFVRKFNRVY